MRVVVIALLLVIMFLATAVAAARSQPAPGMTRLGFITDAQESGGRVPLRAAIDLMERVNVSLVLYGGDTSYEYGDVPDDWSSAIGPYATRDKLHVVYGNHDGEEGYRAFQPQSDETWWVTERGGVILVGLDTNRPLDAASPQTRWLDATLAEYEDRVVVLMLHMPWWVPNEHHSQSVAFDGDPDLFTALVAEHRVDLVLGGHEHYYARYETNGTTYVIGGAVDARLRSVPGEVLAEAAAAASVPTVLILDVSACGLRGWTLHEGEVIDAFSSFTEEGRFEVPPAAVEHTGCVAGEAVPAAPAGTAGRADAVAKPSATPEAGTAGNVDDGSAGDESVVMAGRVDEDGEMSDWIEDGLVAYVAIVVTVMLALSLRRRR